MSKTKRREELALLLAVQRMRLQLRRLERRAARNIRKRGVTIAGILDSQDCYRIAQMFGAGVQSFRELPTDNPWQEQRIEFLPR